MVQKAKANGAAVAAVVLRRPTVLTVIDIRCSGSLAAGEASAFALDPPSAVVLQLRISEAGCEASTSYHCLLGLGCSAVAAALRLLSALGL